MGIYDRDYIRVGPKSTSGRGWMSAWSINTWLIVVNVGIFFMMAMSPELQSALDEWGHYSTAKATFHLEVWRYVTFQFLHANFNHVFFNMIALYFFGGMVENYLGRTRYLAFYLVCGIFGAVMYVILNLLGQIPSAQSLPLLLINDPTTRLVGASAGVYGVLMACAFIAPNSQILVMFVFPMRLATAVYLFIGIAFFALFSGSRNAGGEAAHLGGAIAGAYFIRHTQLLRDFFDFFGKATPTKKKRGASGPKARPTRSSRREELDEAEVDRILSKVATQGLHSLNDKEKKILRRATESKHR